jgi:hypothetical protein
MQQTDMEEGNNLKEGTEPKDSQPKTYCCQCLGCVGEWTGVYSSLAQLKKDIALYCRTGQATYHIIEQP